MSVLDKILKAGLNLNQIIICYGDRITNTKSIPGQGEQLTFDDGLECIYDDSDYYIMVYAPSLDTYVTWERQGNRFNKID